MALDKGANLGCLKSSQSAI